MPSHTPYGTAWDDGSGQLILKEGFGHVLVEDSKADYAPQDYDWYFDAQVKDAVAEKESQTRLAATGAEVDPSTSTEKGSRAKHIPIWLRVLMEIAEVAFSKDNFYAPGEATGTTFPKDGRSGTTSSEQVVVTEISSTSSTTSIMSPSSS
eukprot:GSA25T00027049001.1